MNKEYTDIEKEIIEKAKNKALSILAYADRTEKQLRDKLSEKEFPEYAVTEAVEFVCSLHYIDDRRFAETFIAVRKTEKSRFEMEHALKDKGVSDEVIREVFDTLETDFSENIKNLFLKKYGHRDMTDPKLYEKAFRYFASKGYGFEDIKKGIREALEGAESED